jgi:hypothetical protein
MEIFHAVFIQPELTRVLMTRLVTSELAAPGLGLPLLAVCPADVGGLQFDDYCAGLDRRRGGVTFSHRL